MDFISELSLVIINNKDKFIILAVFFSTVLTLRLIIPFLYSFTTGRKYQSTEREPSFWDKLFK